jgi:RNA polymerase sigma-70 factor (ECF subfamily)
MNNDLFWQLLEAEHPGAEAFCRKLTGNRDEGDDLYQDALLVAMGKFETLRDRTSFRPWLYRILINQYHNRNRQPWWRRRVNVDDGFFDNSASRNPEDVLWARRWLQRALAALPPADRALIVLYEIEGWSIRDLSALVERPEGTVKSRLARAREKMRARVAKCLPAKPSNPTCEVEYALSGSKTTDE